MKILEDLSEKELILLKEEIIDFKIWIDSIIQTKIMQCKDNFKKKWLPFLEKDPEIDSYPKNFDKFMDLVMSRTYYRSREDEERISKMNQFAKFAIK